MKRSVLLVIAFATMALLPLMQSCQSASKVSAPKMLEFDPGKGKGYDYEMEWNIEQGLMGNIHMLTGYSLEVTGKEGENNQISAQYNGIQLTVKVLGKEIKVDTKNPTVQQNPGTEEEKASAMINNVFSGMIGKKFVMTVNKEGEIVRLDGMKELFGSLSDTDTLRAKDPQADEKGARMVVEDKFNEEMFREQFSHFFFLFPAKEVKVGDSWEKSFDAGGKLPAGYATTYTVKEIEGDYITLESESKVEGNEKEAQISGTQTGNFLVDSKNGLVINAEIEQDMIIKTHGFSLQVTGKGTIKGRTR